MSNPVSMAAQGFGAFASIMGMFTTKQGGDVAAQGQKVQAQAQADADLFKSQEYQYQAAVARQNQTIMKQNATYAIAAGEVEAQQSAIQTKEAIGTTRAQQGAGNLDINSGSPADVRMSMFEIGEENMALIRSNAAKTAYGDTVKSIQFGEQAQWDDVASSFSQQSAAYAKTAGDIAAAGTILGTQAKLWSQAGQLATSLGGGGGGYSGGPGGTPGFGVNSLPPMAVPG